MKIQLARESRLASRDMMGNQAANMSTAITKSSVPTQQLKPQNKDRLYKLQNSRVAAIWLERTIEYHYQSAAAPRGVISVV